jgi:hypothetical protein
MEVNTITTTDPLNMYNYINNVGLNPFVFIIVILIIIGYLVIFSSLGNNEQQFNSVSNASNGNGYGYGQGILGVLVIIILVLLILINGLQYFFKVDVSAYLKNLFTDKPGVDIVINKNSKVSPDSNNSHGSTNSHGSKDIQNNNEHHIPSVIETKIRKQVFNVPGNSYKYDDAKAICNAYGADLATYQQVESAYKNGAEWCNYGWSDGQMALFPTQQQTFDNLQKIKGHEHDCGRPGINGGYMANPQLKFGVNCYGIKPKITQDEEEMMKIASPYPKTMQEIDFQKKVDYWKNKVNEIMLSPFNYNMWGQA